MPASMPDATDDGMSEISLVSGLSTPVRMSSTATMMKAPTASAIVKPELTATSAAPGVDHAAIIGIRVRQLSHAVSNTCARQIAVTQLAVWSGVAPTALAAAMMMASVPPRPTIAATNAEIGIDSRMLGFDAGHRRDGIDDHVEILRPRQAMVAIGDERDGEVVGRQMAGQLQRMASRARRDRPAPAGYERGSACRSGRSAPGSPARRRTGPWCRYMGRCHRPTAPRNSHRRPAPSSACG